MKTRFIECMAAVLLPFAVATLPTSALATVNTIGQLKCSAGEVALFDGAKWVCSGEFSDFTASLEALEQALLDETAAREAADTLLEQALSVEEAARIAGDAGLQTQINNLEQALREEELTRNNEDGLLWGQIYALNDLVGLLAGECDEGEAVVGIELVNDSYQIVCSDTALPIPEECPCYTLDGLNNLTSAVEIVETCANVPDKVRFYAEADEFIDHIEVESSVVDSRCVLRTYIHEIVIQITPEDEAICRALILESDLWDTCMTP